MHGRSRMTVDPRIPIDNAGTEARLVFTDQADIVVGTKREAP